MSSTDRDLIVHIIRREKFTTGYINFFNNNMPEWEHHFFTQQEGRYGINPSDISNLHYYSHDRDILKAENIELLKRCKKIIISGVLCYRLIRTMPMEFVRKTYLHFWGGDFDRFKFQNLIKRENPIAANPVAILKWFINKFYLRRFIKNCAGIISLIDRDMEELVKVFPNNVKHFTAQMPSDVLKVDFDGLASSRHESWTVRIQVGHSSSWRNYHDDIFEKLKHLKDADIEILSPLSYGYGKPDYCDKVIKLGHQIFGNKFKPIVDYIPKEEYPIFLSSIDVAVFNNDKQCALGNIWLLLRLGKKVYLREGTSMWDDFKSKGAYIYPISELAEANLSSLVYIPEDGRKINMTLAEECLSNKLASRQWKKVLND